MMISPYSVFNGHTVYPSNDSLRGSPLTCATRFPTVIGPWCLADPPVFPFGIPQTSPIPKTFGYLLCCSVCWSTSNQPFAVPFCQPRGESTNACGGPIGGTTWIKSYLRSTIRFLLIISYSFKSSSYSPLT